MAHPRGDAGNAHNDVNAHHGATVHHVDHDGDAVYAHHDGNVHKDDDAHNDDKLDLIANIANVSGLPMWSM